jgi:catalase
MSTMQSVGNGTRRLDKLDDAATLAMLVTAIGAQHQTPLFDAFGTLRITEEIPEAARIGPFASAPPMTYRVACRISSGRRSPQADTSSDVCAIALKLFTEEGAETDLLMTNEGGHLHARNAAQFKAVADIIVALLAEGTVSGIARSLREMMAARFGPVEGARILANLFDETSAHHIDSVATEHYWGPVVQRGPAALRYSLHPHASTPAGTYSARHGDNALRAELFNRLEQGPVKWKFGVQCFVDDASVAYKSDVVMIGELEIDAPPTDDDEARINRSSAR